MEHPPLVDLESLKEVEEDRQTPIRCMVGDVLPPYATCARTTGELKWEPAPPHISRDLPVNLPEEYVSDPDDDPPPASGRFSRIYLRMQVSSIRPARKEGAYGATDVRGS